MTAGAKIGDGALPPETGGEAPEKRKNPTLNLALRAVSSLSVLFLAYFALRRDLLNPESGNWASAMLVAIFTLPCLREFYRLARAGGARPMSGLGYVLGPLWPLAMEWDLSGGIPRLEANLSLPVAAAVLAMLLQLTRKINDNALGNVSVTIFGLIYCSLIPSLLLCLLRLELSPGGRPMDGIEFVVVCVFVAKVTDIGALLVGSRWGRRRMIRRLSPGKTWEGAAGGLLFGVFLLQFMVHTAPGMALAKLGTPLLVSLSILLAAGGMAGDLAESAFKRGGRQKDAGTGVPGFGGMLDLVDSIMIALPVMYFFLILCGARS
ncbi:MAG: phosphatidate cytidylyltransferase [Planctomycetota bacterium]|nr:phosphatidate cytidylyltransferase [Planctomycetota bacterium]